MRLHTFLSFAVLQVLLSCTPTLQADQSSEQHSDASWVRAKWVSKVARLLSAETSPPDAAELKQLLTLEDDEVVKRLIAKSDFQVAVADFNLFFLGFKADAMIERNGEQLFFAHELFTKPQAINAALALGNGGDYKQTLIAIPQQNFKPGVYDPHVKDPIFQGLTPEQKLYKLRDRAMDEVDRILPLFYDGTTFNRDRGCQAVFNSPIFSKIHFGSGGDDSFSFKTFSAHLDYVVDVCYTGAPLPQQIIAGIKNLKTIFEKLTDFYLVARTHRMESLEKLTPFSLRDIGLPDPNTRFTNDGFWRPFENSSTNANRRRAAYILKTYFCDDLAPLNVALPKTHTGGSAHATDPSCQACHYKLDPMAGFFRNHGVRGRDYSGIAYMRFDDNVGISGSEYNAYMNQWKFPSGGPTTWNVGYIRSATNMSRNDYGSTLGDLFKIIGEAPEVNRCLVKRLAQYLIGTNQSLDGGWIGHLTEQFSQAPSSNDGLRTVVASIVKSKAVRAAAPDSNICYDLAPGQTASPVPCQASHIIESNCAGCHRGSGAAGGLDLTSWKDNGQGEKTFPHIDDGGKVVSKKQTFSRILDRLSSNDPDELMPLNKEMGVVERATLYRWVEQIHSTLEVDEID